MKIKICFTILILVSASITFSQSQMNYQSGTGIVVQPGADICADNITINGSFSGGGTICGGAAYILNLKAFIEGFYNSSLNTIVSDTIRVYLRMTTSPFSKVDSAKSKLDSSGAGTFFFSNISNGTNYYIVLKHRNSIETWSNSGNSFTSGSLVYDFTTASNKAYGSNQIQIDASPVRFAIYSGDVNQDGAVDLSDLSLIDNDAYNFVSGYKKTDLNGDNFTDLSDYTIADNNSYNFVSVVKP
jgi:hypothetical protein